MLMLDEDLEVNRVCAILRACDSLPIWRKTALLQIVQILSISGELNTNLILNLILN